jgi:hypothetical protein
MFDAAWLEISDFTLRIAASGCIWNVTCLSASHNKMYPIYSAVHAGDRPF